MPFFPILSSYIIYIRQENSVWDAVLRIHDEAVLTASDAIYAVAILSVPHAVGHLGVVPHAVGHLGAVLHAVGHLGAVPHAVDAVQAAHDAVGAVVAAHDAVGAVLTR